jgi:hypothetical protein
MSEEELLQAALSELEIEPEALQGMVMNYMTVYDPDSGKILETHASPVKLELVGDKSFVEQKGNPKTQYVKDGEVTDRPVMSVTLDDNMLRGVPKGASIQIDSSQYKADGTDIELSFSIQAQHSITIELWPYIQVDLTYEN